MKSLLIAGLLFISTLSLKAQVIGSVTKITAPTSSTGSLVLEDTITATTGYFSPRRGDVFVSVIGSGTLAKLFIYTKGSLQTLWSGLLTPVYVLGAGGNPTTQTNAQKITYLKANTN